jgi:hypothetical protein
VSSQPHPSGQLQETFVPPRSSGRSMCLAAREAEGRHLRWFLLENYGSLSTLRQLEERSYCVRHAGWLAAVDNQQLSVTFEYLVKVEQQELAELVGGRRRARRAKRVTPAECPACTAGLVAARAEASRTLQGLTTEGGRAAYACQEGPCREHLRWLLSEVSGELAVWLLEQAQERMTVLRAELEQYFHHLDHRFRHEPTGHEQVAWRRALRYFWGEVDASARWPGREP